MLIFFKFVLVIISHLLSICNNSHISFIAISLEILKKKIYSESFLRNLQTGLYFCNWFKRFVEISSFKQNTLNYSQLTFLLHPLMM